MGSLEGREFEMINDYIKTRDGESSIFRQSRPFCNVNIKVFVSLQSSMSISSAGLCIPIEGWKFRVRLKLS